MQTPEPKRPRVHPAEENSGFALYIAFRSGQAKPITGRKTEWVAYTNLQNTNTELFFMHKLNRVLARVGSDDAAGAHRKRR